MTGDIPGEERSGEGPNSMTSNMKGKGVQSVTEWTQGLWGPSITVDSFPETRELELWLSMPEFDEKERNYLF